MSINGEQYNISSTARPDFGVSPANIGHNKIVKDPLVTGYELRNDNILPVYAQGNWWDVNGPQTAGLVYSDNPLLSDPMFGNERLTPPQIPVLAQLAIENYPNPFNASTEIKFTLPEPGALNIRIYDISGRLVKDLINTSLEAGQHSIIWDGTDMAGQKVSSGVYLYSLSTPHAQAAQKMVILK